MPRSSITTGVRTVAAAQQCVLRPQLAVSNALATLAVAHVSYGRTWIDREAHLANQGVVDPVVRPSSVGCPGGHSNLYGCGSVAMRAPPVVGLSTCFVDGLISRHFAAGDAPLVLPN